MPGFVQYLQGFEGWENNCKVSPPGTTWATKQPGSDDDDDAVAVLRAVGLLLRSLGLK